MEATFEKNYITDRETFFKIKEAQKAIAGKYSAREHNIVYGMLRGKTYKQIEPKVKAFSNQYSTWYNEPSVFAIKELIKTYGLPQDFFFDTKGALK